MSERSTRSLSDLISEILDNRRKMVWFALFLIFCLVVTYLFVWAVFTRVESLGKKGVIESFDLSSTNIGFSFRSPAEGMQYFYLVHPQGWINSEILVKEGDILEFETSGNVNLSLDEIIRSINYRREVERELGGQLPENEFTEDHIDTMMVIHGWTGPEGEEGTENPWLDETTPERALLRVLPNAHWGELLVGFFDNKPKIEESERDRIFRVGKQKTIIAPQNGSLWFIVNDYLYTPDNVRKIDPYLYFHNNLGFFWVKITKQDAQ